MREAKCETVRREIEELMLGDECSTGATQHLRECGDCREFQQKQTKLRQIVGSLGTVEAPPDFDFRLRARLASESSSSGFHLRMMQWSFASKGFAAATMVLLFVGGVVYVRTINHQAEKVEVAEQRPEPPQPAPKPVENKAVVREQTPVVTLASETNETRRAGGERRVPSKAKAPLVAVDFGSERAPVISDTHRHSPIFPIDASLQPFKVSIDDGRGNARTISVPTITFGSQRVLPIGSSFAQKSDVVW
ncbi:MAG TPA: hypothetical protein VFM63_01520 [Pyrinomonadaceae bacterium]|nr:hypothetical protein [Pyrinomonadaceae bacterium]